MSEPLTVEPPLIDTYYTEAGVPTFDAVRDKIESRVGQSIGESELAQETEEGRDFQKQWDDRQQAGKDRLEQLRKSMGGNS